MKETIDHRPYLILLSHKDKNQEKYLIETITSKISNVSIKTFTELNEIINLKSDLIIINTNFEIESQNFIKNILSAIHYEKTPYLILFSKSPEDENDLSQFMIFDNVIDFLKDPEVSEPILLNKIKTLLRIPKICRENEFEQNLIQQQVWKILDYSNFFVVIVDKNLNIKLCNYHLAKTLGYVNEDIPVGESWIKFLKPTDLNIIKHIHQEILNKSDSYREFTNDIIDKNKNFITVKWFNSLINGSFNCVFSIGVPLTSEPSLNEDIDSIRAYFRDIIDKDKTTINAIKEVTSKYNDLIMGNK